MTDSRPLEGRRVLVIEDDYYIADDTSRWLERAGARVIGPVPTTAEAARLVDRERVDCAVVDINLGAGPTFEIAAKLEREGVPFLFATGYDGAVIPAEHASAPRLEKPFAAQVLVRAVSALGSGRDDQGVVAEEGFSQSPRHLGSNCTVMTVERAHRVDSRRC